MSRLLLAAGCAALLSVSAFAQSGTADLAAAAETGDAAAAFEYGYALTFPDSDDPDYETGRYWLARAADEGLSDANFSLGIVYADGLGTAADLDRARAFFELAWMDGHVSAGFALAELLIYEFPDNAQNGLDILEGLAERPEEAAAAHLLMAEARLFTSEDLLNEQAALDHARQALAANPSLSGAWFILGIGEMEGFDGTPDPQAARQAWQNGAEGGDVSSMMALAYALENGEGGDADPVEALALLQTAAALGDVDAAEEAARLENDLDPAQRLAARARADTLLAGL